MKNLIFGLVAMIMTGSFSYGQKEIKLTNYGFFHNVALSL